MQVKLTVVVSDEGTPLAQGEITGELDINKEKQAAMEPVLTVRMRNILAAVREVIRTDSAA